MRLLSACLALSCAGAASLPPPANSTDAARRLDRWRDVSVGVLPGYKNIWDREADYGVRLDRVLYFQDIKKLNFAYVRKYLDSGFDVTLCLEFFADYANLQSIADGAWDSHIDRIARDIRDDGRKITVRTLHEINGDW